MSIAADLANGLKNWITCRPKLDMDESITWFLFAFVCALGVDSGELGITFSGMLPQISVPTVNLAMVFLCLVVSFVILIEPLLPSKVSMWMKGFRCQSGYQHLRRLVIFIAFTLGWVTGFTMIITTVPELWWLINTIFFMGCGIFLVLGIRLALIPWLALKSANEKGIE